MNAISVSAAKPRGGNGYDGGDATMDLDEPGAQDNILEITPSDFPATQSWEDGQIYDVSELGAGVKLRQISPGKFEVMPGGPAEAAPVAEEGEPNPEGNPAMDDLLGR